MVGGLAKARHHGAGWDLDGPEATVRVEFCSPHVVRVRCAQHGHGFAPEAGFATASRRFEAPHCETEILEDRLIARTPGLEVVVEHDPFRLTVKDAEGRDLIADDGSRGTVLYAGRMQCSMHLWVGERVYGFGERNGPMDHRGPRFQGRSLVCWNVDNYGHDQGLDPLYASVPFLLFLREGRCHGLFVDEPGRLVADVGRSDTDVVSLRSPHGVIDRYVISGPTPRDVLARYTALTGRPTLPPRWALGFHQCRYSYETAADLRWIAQTFRRYEIPCDVLWLDIHALEGFRPLRWNHRDFPEPAKLCGDLREQGFQLITIVDPHLAALAGDPTFEQGKAEGHFVKQPDGGIYHGPVWPSRGEGGPWSVFPDFTAERTRHWWGEQYREFLDWGLAGIWNDMNEPAIFEGLEGTFPHDLRHSGDVGDVTHDRVHNAYGMLMTRATHEGLRRLQPDKRPFVLTRSSYAGGQRYAWIWTGDVKSDWAALQQTIPTLLNLSVSGFALCGGDVGGFVGTPSAELFTRWLQACVLVPFFRAHTDDKTPEQEPWSYGYEWTARNKRVIELRYELLPQVERVVREVCETGVPALRPLWFEFPGFGECWGNQDHYMFGSDLLVAPVLVEGAKQRGVQFPPGKWYELESGEEYQGPGGTALDVDLDTLPIFAREGAIVFRQPVVPHTGVVDGVPRIFDVFPAERSSADWIEDDGVSLDGPRARCHLLQVRTPSHVSLTFQPTRGDWRPAAPRALVVRFHAIGEFGKVRIGRRVAPELDPEPALIADLPADTMGWFIDDQGRLVVIVPERIDSLRVTVDLE